MGEVLGSSSAVRCQTQEFLSATSRGQLGGLLSLLLGSRLGQLLQLLPRQGPERLRQDGRARQVSVLLRTEMGLKIPPSMTCGILENDCAETLQAGVLCPVTGQLCGSQERLDSTRVSCRCGREPGGDGALCGQVSRLSACTSMFLREIKHRA